MSVSPPHHKYGKCYCILLKKFKGRQTNICQITHTHTIEICCASQVPMCMGGTGCACAQIRLNFVMWPYFTCASLFILLIFVQKCLLHGPTVFFTDAGKKHFGKAIPCVRKYSELQPISCQSYCLVKLQGPVPRDLWTNFAHL